MAIHNFCKTFVIHKLKPNSNGILQLHKHDISASDRQQWQSFKKGNEVAFEYLYKTYSAGLYNYGSKFTKDKDLIKECIQDLFTGLWAGRNSVGNPEHVKNYLYKSFRHAVFKKVFQLSKNETYEETENYHFQVALNAEESLIDHESKLHIRTQIQNALSKLTPRQREAIFLKFNEQLSYEEIAEVMGITVKAGYKIMARSLDYLRNNLSKEDLWMLYLLLNLKLFN